MPVVQPGQNMDLSQEMPAFLVSWQSYLVDLKLTYNETKSWMENVKIKPNRSVIRLFLNQNRRDLEVKQMVIWVIWLPNCYNPHNSGARAQAYILSLSLTYEVALVAEVKTWDFILPHQETRELLYCKSSARKCFSPTCLLTVLESEFELL